MAARLYAGLNTLFGSPLSGQELMDLAAPKQQALRDAFLLPDALNAGALQGSTSLQELVVVIAGGGLAGLTTAWYLNQCGVQVGLFESNSRLGGRVRTDRDFIAGRTVEAGAELIGANHPMWIELAATFGLELVEISKESDYEKAGLEVRLRLRGHDLTPDEKEQVYREMQTVIDAIGQDAFNIDPVNPWLSPQAAAFDMMTVAERLDELLPPASAITRSLFEFTLGNDNCAPVSEQSYLGLLALVSAGRVGDDIEGMRGYWEYTETHRCGGGNDQLATMLATQIPEDQLFLDEAVSSINVQEDRVGYTTSRQGTGAGDYFVLAVPPTVWPPVTSHLPWEPAGRTMSHGPAVKYLNSFASQFWADSQLAPSALSDDIGSVWEGTDQQPIEPDTEFGLSVYSGGAFVLDQGNYPVRLSAMFPGYAPTGERFINWPSTPGVMTGYSVPSRGQVTTVGQALAEPHGRLYFAGEQTWVPFFGYMEGALQSGARAAREIIMAECPEAFQ